MAMNLVYSDFKLARRRAREMILECDCDVYVIPHHFGEGVEYSLETRPSDIAVYIARVGFKHKFKPSKKGKCLAFEYAKKFERVLNRIIFVKEIFKHTNGYKFKDGYILTRRKPKDLYE